MIWVKIRYTHLFFISCYAALLHGEHEHGHTVPQHSIKEVIQQRIPCVHLFIEPLFVSFSLFKFDEIHEKGTLSIVCV